VFKNICLLFLIAPLFSCASVIDYHYLLDDLITSHLDSFHDSKPLPLNIKKDGLAYYSYTFIDSDCEVVLLVDDNGIIRKWEYGGNPKGCQTETVLGHAW